jgi:hypothetical protein
LAFSSVKIQSFSTFKVIQKRAAMLGENLNRNTNTGLGRVEYVCNPSYAKGGDERIKLETGSG